MLSHLFGKGNNSSITTPKNTPSEVTSVTVENKLDEAKRKKRSENSKQLLLKTSALIDVQKETDPQIKENAQLSNDHLLSEIANLLKQEDIDLSAEDNDGCNALHYAMVKNNTPCLIRLLVRFPESANEKTAQFFTRGTTQNLLIVKANLQNLIEKQEHKDANQSTPLTHFVLTTYKALQAEYEKRLEKKAKLQQKKLKQYEEKLELNEEKIEQIKKQAKKWKNQSKQLEDEARANEEKLQNLFQLEQAHGLERLKQIDTQSEIESSPFICSMQSALHEVMKEYFRIYQKSLTSEHQNGAQEIKDANISDQAFNDLKDARNRMTNRNASRLALFEQTIILMQTEIQSARTQAINIYNKKRVNNLFKSNDEALNQFSKLISQPLTTDSLIELKKFNNEESINNMITRVTEEKKKAQRGIDNEYENIFKTCKENVLDLINKNIIHNDKATTDLKRFFGRLLTVVSSIAILPIGYMVYKHVKYGSGWLMFDCKTQKQVQTAFEHVKLSKPTG